MKQETATITSYDVARAAKVSIGTVIRVLHNRPNVSTETRLKVQQAIKDLGYVHTPKKRADEHEQHRQESVTTYKTIIFCVKEAASLVKQEAYHYEVLYGAQKECTRQNTHLIFTEIEDGYAGLVRLKAAVEGRGLDGIILVNYDARALIEGIRQWRHVPLVLIDPRYVGSEPIDSVVSDDVRGMREATKHLIGLGHRDIAFIGMPNIYVAESRLDGYHLALSDAEIPFRPELIAEIPTLKVEYGEQAVKRFLEEKLTFTAVVCANDNVALGAIRAIQAAGLRVPEDISVIGFDDHSQAPLALPPLTTVHAGTDEKGQIAVMRLLDRIARPDQPALHLMIPTFLVERASTATMHEWYNGKNQVRGVMP